MKIPEILLIESEHKPGSLAKILAVLGEAGLVVEHLVTVRQAQEIQHKAEAVAGEQVFVLESEPGGSNA